MGIEHNIRLFNNRQDIPVFLNTMDAYFFPSITEGQPNALIEAMLSGLPFVASDIPSIKETVKNTANLYNPLDVEGFVCALEQFYIGQSKRNFALKEDAIRRFDYKERFEEFYNKML